MRMSPQISSSHALLKSSTRILSHVLVALLFKSLHGYGPKKIIYSQSMSFIIITFPFLCSFFPGDNYFIFFITLVCKILTAIRSVHSIETSLLLLGLNTSGGVGFQSPVPALSGMVFSWHMLWDLVLTAGFEESVFSILLDSRFPPGSTRSSISWILMFLVGLVYLLLCLVWYSSCISSFLRKGA